MGIRIALNAICLLFIIAMQTELPRYGSLRFPLNISPYKVNQVRIYLLKWEISISISVPVVVANLTSKTIKSNKGVMTMKSPKVNLLHSSRKGSDSSASSSSLMIDPIIPVKRIIANKKQKRWSLKNGIQSDITQEETQHSANGVQLKAAKYLRKLTTYLIKSPKKSRSPQCKLASNEILQVKVNLLKEVYQKEIVQEHANTHLFSEKLSVHSPVAQMPSLNDAKSMQGNVITLIHCDSQAKRKRKNTL